MQWMMRPCQLGCDAAGTLLNPAEHKYHLPRHWVDHPRTTLLSVCQVVYLGFPLHILALAWLRAHSTPWFDTAER